MDKTRKPGEHVWRSLSVKNVALACRVSGTFWSRRPAAAPPSPTVTVATRTTLWTRFSSQPRMRRLRVIMEVRVSPSFSSLFSPCLLRFVARLCECGKRCFSTLGDSGARVVIARYISPASSIHWHKLHEEDPMAHIVMLPNYQEDEATLRGACVRAPQGDQPQYWRATVPTIDGHEPKNWTGTALLF